LNWNSINPVTVLGLVAASLSTLAGLPQLLKVWKTRSTKDLSLITLGMGCSGAVLWLFYGSYIGSLPVLLGNAVGLSILSLTLFFKLRYK
jgi:MtN3 and saliva related transmembrane protein